MAAQTQVLLDNEKKYIAKFFSDASESAVKKIDVSTLTWAKHTLTLSATATEKFKIGEVIGTGPSISDLASASEYYIVTGFTAGASEVTIVGWDYTNKKAAAIDTGLSAGDKIVGGVSGVHTETVANSGTLTELDYDVLVTKIMWITNGLQVDIQWDGSTTETTIAELSGNGTWSMPGNELPGISVNATGDSGNVLGDIQFTTTGHGAGDSYTIVMECKKQSPGYDIPAYEENSTLGFPVDYVLGNFT